MEIEALDTKGKILKAAIDSVGHKGEFTVREIAEATGVNVASINYYFGNKNNLLKEVENYYTDLLYNAQYEVLNDSSLSSFEKLTGWARSLIGFMFQSPALLGLVVNIINEDKDYNPLLVQKIYLNSELQRAIEHIIQESTGITNERVLNYKYMQMFSGVLGTVISKIVSTTYGQGESVFDINREEDLEEYIEILVKGVLTK